jgi:hypothetical protein
VCDVPTDYVNPSHRRRDGTRQAHPCSHPANAILISQERDSSKSAAALSTNQRSVGQVKMKGRAAEEMEISLRRWCRRRTRSPSRCWNL